MSWVWPVEPEYQREILSYVRFDFHPFSAQLEERSKDIELQWRSMNYVYLPLPTRIGTDLNMDYTTNTARISSDRNFMSQNDRPLTPLPGTLYDPGSGKVPNRNLRLPGEDFDSDSGPQSNPNGYGLKSFLDIIDTTWLGQSRRIYTFDFNMICKSTKDSSTAASVCNFLNNMALPILTPMKKDEIVGNQKATHPRMCAIHVEDNSGGSTTASDATRYWLGEFPQLCVLQKVKATRIGGDGNQIIGMINENSGFIPIIYNLKLMFVELEPVYTNGVNPTAKSRSQFFTKEP